MATIVDELIVELGLDPSKLTAGQKVAVDDFNRSRKDLESSGKSLENVFAQLQRRLLTVFALFTGGKGVKEFTQQTIAAGIGVGNLANATGQSVEALSSWRGVASRAGLDADGLASSFAGLAQSWQKIKLGEGDPQLFKALSRARLRPEDLRDQGQALLKFSDWASKQQDRVLARTIGLQIGFGESGVNLALKGRSALTAELENQKKLGIIKTGDVETLRELMAVFSDLTQAAQTVGRAMLIASAPWLSRLAKNITQDLTGQTATKKGTFGYNAKLPESQRLQALEDVDAFVKMGWTPAQAVGIAANLQRESGGAGGHIALGDGGEAYGIAQWHPDRQIAFRKKYGYGIRLSDRAAQREFVNYEMRSGAERAAGARLMKETTPEGAAESVSKYYERPGAVDKEASIRRTIATTISGAKAAVSSTANDNRRTSNSSTTHDTKVGPVTLNINTQAKDPQAVAQVTKRALQFAWQDRANTGAN